MVSFFVVVTILSIDTPDPVILFFGCRSQKENTSTLFFCNFWQPQKNGKIRKENRQNIKKTKTLRIFQTKKEYTNKSRRLF